MRVLLANKFFFRNGGSEAVMFMEREFLTGAGIDVVDFSMQDERNLPSPHDEFFISRQSYDAPRTGLMDRVGTALRLIHSREAVRAISGLIDRTRPDLVHCHNIYHQLTPSIIGAAKRRGVPVVLTLHDYKPVCPVYTRLRHGRPCSDCLNGRFSKVLRHRCAEGSLSRSALLYLEALTHQLLRNYEKLDALIAPSEFMRASVTQSRFPASRVHVIYNGVDTERIAGSAEDHGYALYLGRLSPEKGIETLLAAHAGIADRVPLRVAGTGPLEQSLRERYPRAEFLGHVTGSALEEVVRNAGFVVIPSEWYENGPMSVLEAMGHGKAVVASDIGGIPEFVIHEQTGLLFPPGDDAALTGCLLRLAESGELRRCFGAAGRRRVEDHFSIAQHNVELLRVYLGVLERQKGWRARGAFECSPVSEE